MLALASIHERISTSEIKGSPGQLSWLSGHILGQRDEREHSHLSCCIIHTQSRIRGGTAWRIGVLFLSFHRIAGQRDWPERELEKDGGVCVVVVFRGNSEKLKGAQERIPEPNSAIGYRLWPWNAFLGSLQVF